MNAEKLIIHAHPGSQPSRSVYWLCLIKEIPFDLRLGSTSTPDYYLSKQFLDINPVGGFPVIEDGEFVISQMPAILAYLCDKFEWSDFYPRELRTRARINEYLFNHITFTRLATVKLMAPHVTAVFEAGGPGASEDAPDPTMRELINSAMANSSKLESGRRIVRRMAAVVESRFLGSDSPFLFDQASPTIADIACYGELPQLQWAGLFDYSEFPKLSLWMGKMAKLPYHDLVHSYNSALGDVRSQSYSMERFMQATLSALDKLRQVKGVEVSFSE